ncbi:MAG: F0F1 ATP synthase subunit delta [Campylobacterota bacterium]|nr:F0F1 ATP synthase subunit delta [Campylobacterota bacterium]
MEELIAKRYIKAMRESMNNSDFESISEVFDGLSTAFENEKFTQIVLSPNISTEDKRDILVNSVDKTGNAKLNNLLSLLAENGRIEIIPAIAVEMKKELAREKNSFVGKVFSDSDIDQKAIKGLSSGLSKKVGSTIVLEFIKSDYDGVKVEVDDLGIEINFSKNRLNSQMIDHILKAI